MYVAMWLSDIVNLMNYAQFIITGGSWLTTTGLL